MKNDRFLTGILVGIGVLIVLTLALFFLQRETVDYRADDAPDAVAFNYMLAIDRQDYERAYTYLADTPSKPSYSAFRAAFLQEMGNQRAMATVGSAEIINDEAIVELTITRATGMMFSDSYTERQTVLLERQEGEWKIVQAPWPFWGWDWSYPQK